jgi:hypothetical protein
MEMKYKERGHTMAKKSVKKAVKKAVKKMTKKGC